MKGIQIVRSNGPSANGAAVKAPLAPAPKLSSTRTPVVRILYSDAAHQLHTELTVDDLPEILKREGGVLWVDLVETPPAQARPVLEGIFGFHPLAVDDALEEIHIPKVDDWGDYLYLAFYAVRPSDVEADKELVVLQELDCFLTSRCMVTYQAEAAHAVDRTWQTAQRDPRAFSRGAPQLLYQLLDTLVVDYTLVLEQLDDRVECAEDLVFEEPSEALIGEVFDYRRALLHLRRSLAPQREVLNELSRGHFAAIGETYAMYFRDIYDHMVRLYDVTDTIRDVVNGTLEMYLSMVNNRMNDVMKTLTIITTLFMPLSFLAGFFGMNFFQPALIRAGWTSTGVLWVVIGAMAVLPFVMYWWMRRRDLI